jgi:hypothetical protein
MLTVAQVTSAFVSAHRHDDSLCIDVDYDIVHLSSVIYLIMYAYIGCAHCSSSTGMHGVPVLVAVYVQLQMHKSVRQINTIAWSSHSSARKTKVNCTSAAPADVSSLTDVDCCASQIRTRLCAAV